MSSILYGFFGEDEAQRLFLHHYLNAVSATQAQQFIADDTFRLVGGNKSKVDSQFDEACEIGLVRHQQQCFFIGRDLDDYSAEAFHEKVAAMQARLHSRGVAAILLIPVQCIEHWLWYLHWHAENPGSTKNMSFETQPRRVAKEAVYGTPKCSTKHSNPIVERLSTGLDIEWLVSRSDSFRAFHRQVSDYMVRLTNAGK